MNLPKNHVLPIKTAQTIAVFVIKQKKHICQQAITACAGRF